MFGLNCEILSGAMGCVSWKNRREFGWTVRDAGCLRPHFFLQRKHPSGINSGKAYWHPVFCGKGNTRTQGHNDGNSTGTSGDGSTRMSCKSRCRFQSQRGPSLLFTTATCLGKSTRPGWQILHARTRSSPDGSSWLNLWTKHTGTTYKKGMKGSSKGSARVLCTENKERTTRKTGPQELSFF